jgi:hypothetical protein
MLRGDKSGKDNWVPLFRSCPFLLSVDVDTARPYFLRAERLTSKRRNA